MDRSSFVKKFNTINSDNKEKKSLSELTIDWEYEITLMKIITTKFGPSILCEIKDADNEYVVFLPKRYTPSFTDDDCKEASKSKLKLIYKGKRGNAFDVEIK